MSKVYQIDSKNFPKLPTMRKYVQIGFDFYCFSTQDEQSVALKFFSGQYPSKAIKRGNYQGMSGAQIYRIRINH